MRTKTRKKVLSLLLLAVFLCACSGGKDTGGGGAAKAGLEWTVNEAPDGIWWVSSDEWEVSPTADSRTLMGMGDAGVAYVSEKAPGELWLNIGAYADRGTAVSNVNFLYPKEDLELYHMMGCFPGEAGTKEFWTLWMVGTGAKTVERYELVRYSGQGTALDVIAFGESAVQAAPSEIVQVIKGQEDCYALAVGMGADSRLITFSPDGRLKSSEAEEGAFGMFLLQGNLYLAKRDQTAAFLELAVAENPETVPGGVWEDALKLPVSADRFFVGEQGELYLSDSVYLYGCDLESRELDRILKWDETGLQPLDIRDILLIGQERICVLSYENGAFTVSVLGTSDHPDEREEIVVIGNRYDGQLVNWITGFNRSNKEYKAVLRDPGINETEWKDLQTKLQLMLTSDESPDLIYLGLLENWEELAKKGAFADLTPFLQAGSPIREEDYLPNIWACGTVDGRQIFIPYSISFDLLFGKECYVGSDLGWTLEELLAASRAHPDMSVIGYGPAGRLGFLLTFGLEEFVDEESGTCDFQNAFFYDVLECAARESGREFEDSPDGTRTIFDPVMREESLLFAANINKIEDYLAYQSAVPISEEESVQLAIKGYPSKDGQVVGYGSMANTARLAICGGSAHKEGAWRFIEYVTEETWGDVYSQMSLSAKTDRMRASFLHEGMEITFTDYKKVGLELGEPTEEDIEELLALMGSLKFRTGRQQVIYDIIKEEAQAYFYGQKSAEEVAEIIQGRVRLYLAE